jgi:hypothetical protein
MAKLAHKQIQALARSIIASKPAGIRYSILVKEILQQHPETGKHAVQGVVVGLQKIFPKEISKPERGLFKPVESSGSKEGESAMSLGAVGLLNAATADQNSAAEKAKVDRYTDYYAKLYDGDGNLVYEGDGKPDDDEVDDGEKDGSVDDRLAAIAAEPRRDEADQRTGTERGCVNKMSPRIRVPGAPFPERMRNLPTIAAMEKAQGGKCAICGCDRPGGRFAKFVMDHCHKTRLVRALLCNRCNMRLGRWKDDTARMRAAAISFQSTHPAWTEWLRKAANYVERWATKADCP